MGTFFLKNLRCRAVVLLFAYLPRVFAAGSERECEIRVKSKTVARLLVPLGAATTMRLPEDFDFAIPGNKRDFTMSATPQPRIATVQARSTTARETSLTVVMKSGTEVSFWLVPTSKNQGCVFAHIRRGM